MEYHEIIQKDTKMMYNKSPIYEPSICKLLGIRMCVHMSNHVSANFSSGCTFVYFSV